MLWLTLPLRCFCHFHFQGNVSHLDEYLTHLKGHLLFITGICNSLHKTNVEKEGKCFSGFVFCSKFFFPGDESQKAARLIVAVGCFIFT